MDFLTPSYLNYLLKLPYTKDINYFIDYGNLFKKLPHSKTFKNI